MGKTRKNYPPPEKPIGLWDENLVSKELIKLLDEFIAAGKIKKEMKDYIKIHFDTIAEARLEKAGPTIQLTSNATTGIKEIGGVLTTSLLGTDVDIKGVNGGDKKYFRKVDKIGVKLVESLALATRRKKEEKELWLLTKETEDNLLEVE